MRIIILLLTVVLQSTSVLQAALPNVVVMMVDDMGFAGPSVAPYGNPHYKTPGMDRLARAGGVGWFARIQEPRNVTVRGEQPRPDC